jgi:hypothetical protein
MLKRLMTAACGNLDLPMQGMQGRHLMSWLSHLLGAAPALRQAEQTADQQFVLQERPLD